MKSLLKNLVCFLALVCVLTSCGNTNSSNTPKPIVVSSIAPYKYFIDKISGGEVEVVVLVPSQANPHVFEPGMRLIEQASRGVLWFQMGERFETKIASALKIKTVDLTQGISLIREHHCEHHSHDSYDVHAWLSPKNTLYQVGLIEEALCDSFPEFRKAFHNNAEALKEELIQLDQDLAKKMAGTTQKTLIVSHAAFAYFCRDYGMTQVAIEEEGKDPTLRHVQGVTNLAKEKKASCILIQAQHDSKGALRLSETLNIPAVLVDPYSEDYSANLRRIAELIHTPEKS